MNCPHCNRELSPKEIKSLWGQLNKSRQGKVSPAKAKARAQKAAAARWAGHKKRDSE